AGRGMQRPLPILLWDRTGKTKADTRKRQRCVSAFLFSFPSRGATASPRLEMLPMLLSTHAPLAGSDGIGAQMLNTLKSFQPTLPGLVFSRLFARRGGRLFVRRAGRGRQFRGI